MKQRVYLRLYADMSEVKVSGLPSSGGGVRGDITTFSSASRLRFMKKIAKTRDFATGGCYFATVTYPGDDVPVDWQKWKLDLAALRKRMARMFPDAGAFWRLEPQIRKTGALEGQPAPHFHFILLRMGLPQEHYEKWFTRFRHFHQLAIKKYGRRRAAWAGYAYPKGTEGDSDYRPANPDMCLRVWLRISWWEIVNGCEFTFSINESHPAIDSLFANGQCDRLESRRHAMYYISKYLAKTSPVEMPMGRYWGYFGKLNFDHYYEFLMVAFEIGTLRRLVAAFLRSRKSKYAGRFRKMHGGFSTFALGIQSVGCRASPEPTALRIAKHALGVLGEPCYTPAPKTKHYIKPETGELIRI